VQSNDSFVLENVLYVVELCEADTDEEDWLKDGHVEVVAVVSLHFQVVALLSDVRELSLWLDVPDILIDGLQMALKLFNVHVL